MARRFSGWSVMWNCVGAVLTLAVMSVYTTWSQSSKQTSSVPPGGTQISAMVAAAVRGVRARPRVVASLTTFPIGDRMVGLGKMLATMAEQSWPLDAVILSIPKRISRISDLDLELPPIVDTWREQYSWLQVTRPKDYGPATKLLGALEVEKDPDTIIIIVDDDTYYHRDTVLQLVSSMLGSPRDVAPAFKCEELRAGWFGSVRKRRERREADGICIGFACGYTAYAVRPRFFDKTVWEVASAPRGCWLHDDVWISGSMLVATGVRPMLIRPGFQSALGNVNDDMGHRANESVYVAHMAAIMRGEDPQAECVAHFPFTQEVAAAVMP